MKFKTILILSALLMLFFSCQVPKAGELLTREQSLKIFKKYCKKKKIDQTKYQSAPDEVEKYHVFVLTEDGSPGRAQQTGIWIDRRNADIGPYNQVQPAVREKDGPESTPAGKGK